MLNQRRASLLRAVKIMFALLGLALFYVLISSLGGEAGRKQQSSSVEFDDIAPGQTVGRRINGQAAWISRISGQQRQDLISLQPYLLDPTSGCPVSVPVCALSASGARDGIQISYSKKAPPQLPRDAAWYGGFVDPASGTIFDLLGRAYRLGRESDQQTMQQITLSN
ncbi:MAG: hypothetical protein AAF431_02865 [Pseudomonadota bacterium]